MTIAIANTSNSSSYQYWINRTNDMAYAMSTKVITVDSNTTSGNAVLNGTFQANTIKADTIVANGNALTISSNTLFSNPISIGNSTVNSTANSTAFTSGRMIIGGTITGNSTVLAIGANVLLTTSSFFVGNSTVNTSVNSSSFSINGTPLVPTFAVNTNITASTTVVDSFDLSVYRSSEYVMSVKNNTANGYQVSKLLVVHDDSNASIAEFGVISTNSTLGVFTANSNTTHVKVYLTLAGSVTDVQVKGIRTPVPI